MAPLPPLLMLLLIQISVRPGDVSCINSSTASLADPTGRQSCRGFHPVCQQ